MESHPLITFRVGYAGRHFEVRLGRSASIAAAVVAAVLFVLFTQGIHDIRANVSKLRELRSLRDRVSEQNLVLHNLHAKFEGLVAEVDRIRAMNTRIQFLDPDKNPFVRPVSGVGGGETPESPAPFRLDRLLDRKFDQMKKELLVEVENLDMIGERLNDRRIVLESIPTGWPVRGYLSSCFGTRISPFTGTPVFHEGLDIVALKGTGVACTGPGMVVKSGFEALLGNVVVVDHGGGYQTVYAHLSSRRVEESDFVERGEMLGEVGATGRATGPHLHYEVRVDGLRVNPARFLN